MSKNSTDKVTKVYHVVRRFSESDWGGTESVVYNLSQQYEQKGVQSPILSTDMLSKPGSEEMGLVRVCRFPYVFPWLGLSPEAKKKLALKGGSPLCLKMLFFLLSQKDISILHAHTEHRLGGIVRTVARWRKIPYVVTLHGGNLTLSDEQATEMKTPFKGKWEWGKLFGALLGSRRVLKDSDAVICVGRDEYQLMKQKYPEKNVVYQANGVNTALFQKVFPGDFRQEFGIPSTRKIILCVSRLDPQKNQLLLLHSCADLLAAGEDLHLLLIGPLTVESYGRELEDFIKEKSLEERVTIIPGLKATDPRLVQAYQAADIFVLPSRYEPFGIVILEAWSAGIPVIASNVGGVSGFTEDGKDILLFKDDDQEALSQLLQKLLVNEDLQSTLVAAALEKVKDYDWQVIAQQNLALYEKLLGDKRE